MTKGNGEYVVVDGLKTFYIKAGTGRPLLLIHGGSPGASSSVSWKLNVNPLAAMGFTVYAIDQPGFGHTDNPKDYSVDYRVTHLRSFIKALQLENFCLIGNSQGAYIAARIALEDRRAKGLVLVSSGTLAPEGSSGSVELAKKHREVLRSYTPTLENMRKLSVGTLFKKSLVTDDFVKERYQLSAGKNFEAHLARAKTGGAQPIYNELKNIGCKTLILWGKNDRGAAVERAVLLFGQLPGAELHLFDQCSHWVQWDQADRFNRIVPDFLDGNKKSSAD